MGKTLQYWRHVFAMLSDSMGPSSIQCDTGAVVACTAPPGGQSREDSGIGQCQTTLCIKPEATQELLETVEQR